MAQSLFDKWIRGEGGEFYSRNPHDPEARHQAVRDARQVPISQSVWEAIWSDNQKLPPSPARDANLKALSVGAACVVTGQQVGLFSGPLFTLYKSATAIQAAKQLEEESGERVVPVFWLQSEDHDIAEVAQTHALGKDGGLLQLALSVDSRNRRSVEHLRLPSQVQGLIDEMEVAFSDLPHSDDLLSLLERHYQEGHGWVESFAGLLAELFAEEGLIIVNPRLIELQQAANPIYRMAIERSEALGQALVQQSSLLEAQGFRPTVHVRQDSPLVFYHPQGREGPRHRLIQDGECFHIPGVGETYQRGELLLKADEKPELFSTSALLRPLVQDFLLPTAAYVGGAAEVSYFAQVQALYRYTQEPESHAPRALHAPLVMVRARLRVLEARSLRLLDRLDLTLADSALPQEELLRRCQRNKGQIGILRDRIQPLPDEEALIESGKTGERDLRLVGRGSAGESARELENVATGEVLKASAGESAGLSVGGSGTDSGTDSGTELETNSRTHPENSSSALHENLSPGELEELLWKPFESRLLEAESALLAAGPQMQRVLKRTRRSVEIAVERLSARYQRALLRQDQELVESVQKLKNLLHPHGVAQERVHNFSWYAARYGVRHFIESILKTADEPFVFTPKDFKP